MTLYTDRRRQKISTVRLLYRPTRPHLEGPSRLKSTYSTRLAGIHHTQRYEPIKVPMNWMGAIHCCMITVCQIRWRTIDNPTTVIYRNRHNWRRPGYRSYINRMQLEAVLSLYFTASVRCHMCIHKMWPYWLESVACWSLSMFNRAMLCIARIISCKMPLCLSVYVLCQND